jgi:hypothetical protein
MSIYKFHSQHNNCLVTYVTLRVLTLTGHPQVLQVSQLLNCNAYIPIYIHMVYNGYFLCIFNSIN